MNPITGFTPRFGNHSTGSSFTEGWSRAYDWTQGRYGTPSNEGDKIGFYSDGGDYPQYHVVSGAHLEEAIQRKQPHLVILQRFNDLGRTLGEIYKGK
jgi:hypothetical protein